MNLKRGKRFALPKGFCTVCQHEWPGEEMSLCCPSLCHRHDPHPLPPSDMPDWSPQGQTDYWLRTSWGHGVTNTKAGRQHLRNEAGRRKGV